MTLTLSFGQDFEPHSRTDLINSPGCEGKSRASVTMKQDTGDLILLFPSFIQSAYELPWQLTSAACACVCRRGLEKPRGENDVSSERIKSPQFSQVCGIFPLSCLMLFSHCKQHEPPCVLCIHNTRQCKVAFFLQP